jgi:hypothetical protein
MRQTLLSLHGQVLVRYHLVPLNLLFYFGQICIDVLHICLMLLRANAFLFGRNWFLLTRGLVYLVVCTCLRMKSLTSEGAVLIFFFTA